MEWLFGKKEKKPEEEEGFLKISLGKEDLKNLPKLEKVEGFKMPKKPKIKTREELDREKEEKERDGKIAYDISKEYDLTTYLGRFRC